jgi:hypothetical protein
LTHDRPEPFTPPDCDLRNYQFMPFGVERFCDSAAVDLLTGDEFKAAMLLWCKSWHQVPAGSLPDDDRQLAKLAGFGRAIEEWQKVKKGALYGFVLCSDGRLYHPVVCEYALNSWSVKRTNSDNGKSGAQKRWGSRSRSSSKNSADNGPAINPDGGAMISDGEATVSDAAATNFDGEKIAKDSKGKDSKGSELKDSLPLTPPAQAQEGGEGIFSHENFEEGRERRRPVANPRALETNPRALGTNPRAIGEVFGFGAGVSRATSRAPPSSDPAGDRIREKWAQEDAEERGATR